MFIKHESFILVRIYAVHIFKRFGQKFEDSIKPHITFKQEFRCKKKMTSANRDYNFIEVAFKLLCPYNFMRHFRNLGFAINSIFL